MDKGLIFEVCEPMFTANNTSIKKKVVNQGGTGSAKTYTILQVLHMKLASTPGLVCTVVGQDVPNLKKGAIRDSNKIIASSPFLQNALVDYARTRGYNKTDRIHEYKNGSIMEFASFDTEQDAKSGKRDYLFLNEANGVSFEIYFQLAIRTRIQVFLDYNPTARFWVHDKLIGQPDVQLIISDHRHNKFMPKQMHDEIERLYFEDRELWKVYGRGLTGKIEGLIYNKYRVIEDMPLLGKPMFGLDFGYNHKTALIEIRHDTGRLFWDEHIYQSELTIGDLIPMMRELGIGRNRIYADHAAPDKIEDLKRAGFNVHKADKDIKNGIDFIKRNELYVTRRSKGILKEIMAYKYKVNKDGITLDEPVKFMDDAMDAARYGAYTGFRKPGGIIIGDGTDYDDMGYLDFVEEAA